jgi:hypothetical protein
MAQHLVFSHLLWIALGWLCLLLPAWWPATPRATLQRPLQPEQPRRTRSQEPPPWLGFSSNRSGPRVHALGRHGPRRLHHRPLGLPAPEDANRRATRRTPAGPLGRAPRTAGQDGATSAPMGLPAAQQGGSGSACSATGRAQRPMARSGMGTRGRPSAGGGGGRAGRQGWAAGARRGASRASRTQGGPGGGRRRSRCEPLRRTACLPAISLRAHSLRSTPACRRARMARAGRPRPARAGPARRRGGGRRGLPSASGGSPSRWVRARGRWPRGAGIRACQGSRLTGCRGV